MSHRSISIAAALAALALPLAGASASQDWRSPDARDAGQPKIVLQDWRSPDARDVAAGRFVTVAPAPLAKTSPAGFDWGDAGVGAAGALGIALLLAGAGVLVIRRRGVPV
jgi:hypothetical protein